jgi:hypothetical protein
MRNGSRSLSENGGRLPGEAIQQKLLATAARDIEELLLRLEPRAEEWAEVAVQRLCERGEREAHELRETLERQRARVRNQLQKYEDEDARQPTLGFDEEEERQIEADVRSWRSRPVQFDRDLREEPARIHDFYEVRARRIEPVGIVYLWPESN